MKCRMCRKDKSEDDFAWENKSKGRRQSKCKQCQRNLSKNHYQRNKQKYAKAAASCRSKGKEYIKSYLADHPCIDCREADVDVLDFDHRSDKLFTIGGNFGLSIDKLQQEIDKCDVRCGNCHRRKTLLRSKTDAENDKNKYQKRVRREKRRFIDEYLSSHPCMDCNESDVLVLEFDHVRGKKYGISFLTGSRLSLATLKKEIAKCEVRCVNCHRKKHKKGGNVEI